MTDHSSEFQKFHVTITFQLCRTQLAERKVSRWKILIKEVGRKSWLSWRVISQAIWRGSQLAGSWKDLMTVEQTLLRCYYWIIGFSKKKNNRNLSSWFRAGFGDVYACNSRRAGEMELSWAELHVVAACPRISRHLTNSKGLRSRQWRTSTGH